MTPESGAQLRVSATRHPLIEAGPDGLPPLPKTAWIEVDLDAIAGNLRTFRSLVPAGSKVQPVVKADAYGHGAVAVSRALVAAGVEALAVATFDEALELRQAGIDVPILVQFPIPPELAPAALRHRISITLGDDELAERTLAALSSNGAGTELARATSPGLDDPAEAAVLDVHLELETGLGRGGVMPERAPELARRIEECPRARLAGVWTHLQAADNPAITSAQQTSYEGATALLGDAGVSIPLRHMSASGGILAATAAAYDAVRIGISLYGLVPDGVDVAERHCLEARGLTPALSLRARPVRVANLPAGWGVSYGPTFRTTRPSVIATLPLGYADGWPRSLSNKAELLVRGRRVPQVGTVAMDAIMVDVTDVPGEPVTIDDEFTLIGTQGDDRITAHDVARWSTTISYEVVSVLSGRIPRVYYANSKPVALRTVSCEVVRTGGV